MIGRRAPDRVQSWGGSRRRRSLSYPLWESADTQLARHVGPASGRAVIGTFAYCPFWPHVTSDFETPTVHPTHLIRMGWNSFIWKEVLVLLPKFILVSSEREYEGS